MCFAMLGTIANERHPLLGTCNSQRLGNAFVLEEPPLHPEARQLQFPGVASAIPGQGFDNFAGPLTFVQVVGETEHQTARQQQGRCVA